MTSALALAPDPEYVSLGVAEQVTGVRRQKLVIECLYGRLEAVSFRTTQGVRFLVTRGALERWQATRGAARGTR